MSKKPRSKNFVALLLVALLGGGAFLFFKKYEIVGLDQLSVRAREASAKDGVQDASAEDAVQDGASNLPPARKGETIRIASFNIQVFGQSKLEKAQVMQDLAKVVRQFDVVAIQEIRSKEPVMPRFIEIINSTGQHNYGYVIGERLGRTSSKEQYAFVSSSKEVIAVDFQVEGKPRSYDVTDELREACESVLPDLIASARELITTFDPEFQFAGGKAFACNPTATFEIPGIPGMVKGVPWSFSATSCPRRITRFRTSAWSSMVARRVSSPTAGSRV